MRHKNENLNEIIAKLCIHSRFMPGVNRMLEQCNQEDFDV